MESQNHLIDAVDKGLLDETTRLTHNTMAETALEEVTGLMEYLQSPEALKNARRARERRMATRPERLAQRTSNLEERTPNRNPEPGIANRESRTGNREPGTANREPRTGNREPGNEPEPEHERRSVNGEV
jgi:hypothetical protein